MSALGGYASHSYERIEDLAEKADWTGRGEAFDQAITDYVQALHALAATRGGSKKSKTHWRQTGKDDLQARARSREARAKQPIKRRRGLGRVA